MVDLILWAINRDSKSVLHIPGKVDVIMLQFENSLPVCSVFFFLSDNVKFATVRQRLQISLYFLQNS